MTNNIHKRVMVRLFVVWLLMTPTMAALVTFLELERVDRQVLDLVLEEVGTLDQTVIDQMAQNPNQVVTKLQEFASELVDLHFVVVDIYNENRTHLAEKIRYGSDKVQEALESGHHKFPLDNKNHHEKLRLDGELYVQALFPLMASNGELAGYFEGVYRVSAARLKLIEAQVFQIVLFVIIIVSATTVTLYPIILYLNRQLIKFSRDVFQANVELMEVMGASISKRDSTTDAHNYRVTLYAVAMGKLLNFKDDQMRNLIAGAFLHDVGKLGVPDAILGKAGELTETETQLMHEHVSIGLDIIQSAQWLHGADEVIKYHHEHYDGNGYMEGLKGEEIPVNARIFGIIDVFDAMMSERPYKKPFDLDQTLALMLEERGSHFDPVLLDLFVKYASQLFESIGQASYSELTQRLSSEIKNYFFDARLEKSKA